MPDNVLGRIAAVALPLVLAACGGTRLAPADTMARVGGDDIPYAEFEGYVSSRVGLDAATSSLVLSGLLDQFLDEILLRSLAVDEGSASPETPGWEAVDSLLVKRQAAQVSSAEIAAYYRANRGDFVRPERVVLRQVLAEREEAAAEAGELLNQEIAFDELASRFLADGISASESEIAREDLPAGFVDRIFGLESGEVSEVIAADYGFHVFQVVARLPVEESSLEEATPDILETLGLASRRRAVDELVAEARGRYNVEVYARNLPFNYEGRYDSPKN